LWTFIQYQVFTYRVFFFHFFRFFSGGIAFALLSLTDAVVVVIRRVVLCVRM